jgi:hypothetical protein
MAEDIQGAPPGALPPEDRKLTTVYTNSLSGGIASAAAALIAHEEGLDCENVFADTTIEDADLYRFLDDIEKAIDRPLVRLRDGRDPWDVFVKERYIGNSRIAPCSAVLKTRPVRRWIKEHRPQSTLLLGMYLDEGHRLETAARNWAPVPVRSLLIDRKIGPGRAREIVESRGIAIPRLYGLGFPHNNCGGMCVRAGQGQFATLLKHFPARYAHHEQRESEAMASIGPTARPFLTIERNKAKEYLTMGEFRQRVEAGSLTPKLYEMGGCGCFVDDAGTGDTP